MFLFLLLCNTCLTDGPLGVGGRSARQRPDIYLDGRGTHLSFLFSSSSFFDQRRAELVRSPRRRPLSSISLLRPPNLNSSRGNLPRHLLHLPQPLDRLLTAGIIPYHRRSPWKVLEALLHRRSASPVVLRSNRPREWVRGEFLALPGLFPFRGESPAPVNGRRRR